MGKYYVLSEGWIRKQSYDIDTRMKEKLFNAVVGWISYVSHRKTHSNDEGAIAVKNRHHDDDDEGEEDGFCFEVIIGLEPSVRVWHDHHRAKEKNALSFLLASFSLVRDEWHLTRHRDNCLFDNGN